MSAKVYIDWKDKKSVFFLSLFLLASAAYTALFAMDVMEYFDLTNNPYAALMVLLEYLIAVLCWFKVSEAFYKRYGYSFRGTAFALSSLLSLLIYAYSLAFSTLFLPLLLYHAAPQAYAGYYALSNVEKFTLATVLSAFLMVFSTAISRFLAK